MAWHKGSGYYVMYVSARGLAGVVVVGVAGAGLVGGFVAGRASHGSHAAGSEASQTIASQVLVAVPVISQPPTEFVADLAAAARTLRAGGLQLGSVCRVTNEAREGFLGQFPVAGTLVRKGTSIDVLVSNGLRPMDPPGCYEKWKQRGYQ